MPVPSSSSGGVAMSSEPLPGLELGSPPATAVESAARTYLDRLEAAGTIGPDHAVIREAILTLAASLGRSSARGQSAAAALASKELREWYLLIPAPIAADDPFLKILRDAAEADRATAQGHG